MKGETMDNTEDVIDSRAIVERVEDLTGELYEDDVLIDCEDEDVRADLLAELHFLEQLLKQLRDVGGDTPEDGLTLIRDSYFRDYAMELADDIGAIPNGYTWPTSCIDWDQAARELRMDYTSVEFDGVTYWVR